MEKRVVFGSTSSRHFRYPLRICTRPLISGVCMKADRWGSNLLITVKKAIQSSKVEYKCTSGVEIWTNALHFGTSWFHWRKKKKKTLTYLVSLCFKTHVHTFLFSASDFSIFLCPFFISCSFMSSLCVKSSGNKVLNEYVIFLCLRMTQQCIDPLMGENFSASASYRKKKLCESGLSHLFELVAGNRCP